MNMRKNSLVCLSALFLVLVFTGLCFAGLNDGLMAYYPFNGNDDDASGYLHHGRTIGSIGFAKGVLDQAAILDGNSWIVLDNLCFPEGNGTITMWVKVSSSATDGCGFIIDTSTNYRSCFASNNTEVICDCLPHSLRIGFQHVNILTDNWVMLTYSYSNGTSSNGIRKAYVNGSLASQETGYSNNFVRQISSYTNGTVIGTNLQAYGIQNFVGMMDEVRIYNRPLSDAEIQELYNQNATSVSYNLNYSVVNGHGSITASPSTGPYAQGAVVSLIATPEFGYKILAWKGTDNDASTADSNIVTMNADHVVTVEFTNPVTAEEKKSSGGGGCFISASVTDGSIPQVLLITLFSIGIISIARFSRMYLGK